MRLIRAVDAAAAAAAAAAVLWSVARTVRGVDFWSENEQPIAGGRFKSICPVSQSVGRSAITPPKPFNAVATNSADGTQRRTILVHKPFYRLSIQ